MNFKKFYIGLMILAVAACAPKDVNFDELIYVIQSDSMELAEHKPDNSTVYVLARYNENDAKDMQAATEFSLRQKGYDITQNPSNAGYIVHINIPAMGSFNENSLQGVVDKGYGKTVERKSTMQDAENKLAVIADVQVVARFIPPEVRRRPAVVTTTSKPSKLAENSARILAAIPENDDYSLAEARPHLVQKIANNIVASLP